MNDHELLLTGKGALPYRFAREEMREEPLEVPNDLHFIWIGGRVPKKYEKLVDEFAEHNPSWRVILWTDEKADAFRRDMINRDLLDAETNMGARADLIRYEIIYRYGGVYLDIDTVSMGRESLHRDMRKPFVSVSGPPWFNCSNDHFGFGAGSRFLNYVIRNLRDPRVRREMEIPARTGPTFFTTCVLSFGDLSIVHPNGRELMAKIHHLGDGNWVKK